MKFPKLHRLLAIALVSLPFALLAADADMDDAFETNTGTYVSPTNTGTSPAKADTIAAQYGSNLTGWTNAVHQGTGPTEITITAETNGFGAGIDRVTVALPVNLAGAAAKLFVRLNVAVTGL